MTVSLFTQNWKMAPFWPKMSKIDIFGPKRPKMGVLAFFSLENCVLEFPNFLQEAYPLQSKKYYGFCFSWKFENGPFWPKLTQIWSKFGHIWLYRLSVCPLVPAFLEVRWLLFPETLQLVRT